MKKHFVLIAICLAAVCTVAVFAAAFVTAGNNFDWSEFDNDSPWTPRDISDLYSDDFTLTITVEGNGTVNRTDTEFLITDIAILEAVPGEGWFFSGWYIDGIWYSDEPETSLFLYGDRSVTAVFAVPDPEDYTEIDEDPEPDTDTETITEDTTVYTIDITITNTLNIRTPGYVNGNGTYTENDVVTLSAVPDTGYGFDGWFSDGVLLSNRTEYIVTVTDDLDIDARFTPVSYTLHTAVSSDTRYAPGTVSGDGIFHYRDYATVTSTAYSGYVFDGWYLGDVLLSGNPEYSFYVTDDRTVSAHFSIDHDVSFSAEQSSEFAPSVLTVSGYHSDEIVSRTWTLTDAVTGNNISSYNGDGFSRSFGNAAAVKITQSATYSDGYTSEVSCTEIIDEIRSVHYEWKYMESKWYTGVLGVNNTKATYDSEYRFSDYYQYMSSELSRSGPKTQEWVENFVTDDDPVIVGIANDLLSNTSGMTQLQRAQYVSNFVQTIITYETDSAKGVTEYFKFPYETLYEGRGDCEDSALLYISLMKAMGYDTALLILYYSKSAHAVPMVVIDGASGFTLEYDGVKFVCCEVTSDPMFFDMFSKDIGKNPNGWEKGAQLMFYHFL
jgi:uncharacterized repeat protein (TIGR02543 family)